MFNFIWLLFAHYIADIGLQSSWLADKKRKYRYIQFCHCMVWTGLISVALQYLGIFAPWKVFLLLIGHFIIDTWKGSLPITEKNYKYLFVDQAFHIIQLLIVYFF